MEHVYLQHYRHPAMNTVIIYRQDIKSNTDGFYLAGMKELPSGRLVMHLYPRIYRSDSTHAIHDYVRFAEGVQACSAAIEQYGLDNLLAIGDWLYNYLT